MHHPPRTLARLAVALLLTVALGGCTSSDEPVTLSRVTLGTAVSVSAYGDADAARAAAEKAFDAMDDVSASLDAYTDGSAIALFNADAYTEQQLPEDAVDVMDAVESLGVGDAFSTTLWSVTRLYGFETTPTVPVAADLTLALQAVNTFSREGDVASFARLADTDPRLQPGGELAPGLDLGGAAKGLGLDRALEALSSAGVDSAIVSAVSGTATIGSKPDGTPWRIGIEDPRDQESIVAVVESQGACVVATSGDYQRYFEVDGVRYHHILDPATGMPAQGLRSLTVFAPYTSMNAMEADILSTALFVMGADAAEQYARAHDLGLYLIDSEGRAHSVPAPDDSGVRLTLETDPAR